MGDIRVEPSWETDSNWEDDRPRFRVYFHGSSATQTRGWTSTFDITGADVVQVIDWAQRQATGTVTWALALVVDDEAQEHLNPGRGRGLVWLIGADGNMDFTTDPEGQVVHQRMLQRRDHPLQIPPHDQMPAEHDLPEL